MPTWTLRFAFAGLLIGLASVPVSAQDAQKDAPKESPKKAVTVELRDQSIAFAERYEALTQSTDADARLAAWKEQSAAAGFLATQMSEADLAAKVQAVWPQYAAAVDALKAGFNGLKPAPVDAMNRINRELHFQESLKLNFIAYAGLFDNKVYSSVQDGVGTLYLPVEAGGNVIAPAVAREYARIAIRQQLGSPVNQSLADLAVREGLAFRMARAALPELPEERFFGAGELTALQAKRSQILSGIKSSLADSKPETAARFTSGKGSAGLSGEAAYAGYLVVGQWLRSQLDMDYIKKIPRNELPGSVGRVIDVLQKR